MQHRPKNPLHSPPLVSFPHDPLSFSPTSVCSLCMGWVPPNSTQVPLSISSLHTSWVPPNPILNPLPSPLCARVKFPLTWFSVPLLSLLYAWVRFPPTRVLVPLSSPLCARVGFPWTWFLVPLLSPFRALVRFFLTWFPFTSLCWRSMVPNVKL